MPKIPREKALQKIEDYIDKANELLHQTYTIGKPNREKLSVSIRMLLRNSFEDGEQKVEEFDEAVNTYVMALGVEKLYKMIIVSIEFEFNLTSTRKRRVIVFKCRTLT